VLINIVAFSDWGLGFRRERQASTLSAATELVEVQPKRRTGLGAGNPYSVHSHQSLVPSPLKDMLSLITPSCLEVFETRRGEEGETSTLTDDSTTSP
jgi:hypothetical protein